MFFIEGGTLSTFLRSVLVSHSSVQLELCHCGQLTTMTALNTTAGHTTKRQTHNVKPGLLVLVQNRRRLLCVCTSYTCRQHNVVWKRYCMLKFHSETWGKFCRKPHENVLKACSYAQSKACACYLGFRAVTHFAKIKTIASIYEENWDCLRAERCTLAMLNWR